MLLVLLGFGIAGNASSKGVENNFDAAGDSQLVKNPEQVILHSVFGELEPLGDFPIREAVGEAADDVSLAGESSEPSLV